MLKGKTATGFSFSINEEVRDDLELLESITEFDKGDRQLLPKIIVSLLGEKQKEKLYDHCRGKSGRVSARQVLIELDSIFNEINKSENDTKN